MAKLEPIEDQPVEAGWLLSYADMMTLIACFFILMMAFANYDPVGFSKKTKVIAKHFNKDKFKSSMTQMETLSDEVAKHPELKTKTKISVKDGALIVTFSSSVLFSQGQALLSNEGKNAVDILVNTIKDININYRILVEGHTDNSDNAEGSQFSSNWSLSSARAASVIERFEFFGFNPKEIVPIGLSDTKPLLDNLDDKGNPIPENQKMNRRVVIKVLQPIDKGKYKFGFGVYFPDSTE